MSEEIKTDEVGPYRLVARMHQGVCKGVVYADGAQAVVLTGVSVYDCYEQIVGWVQTRLKAQALMFQGTVPSDEKMTRAFVRIAPRMHEGQRAMLRAHLSAHDHRITATELAAAAGYRSYEAANLHYGKLGWWLYGEVPTELPEDLRTEAPVYTFALCDGASEDQGWVWTLKPEVARAVVAAGLVA